MTKQRQAGGIGFIGMMVLLYFFELIFYRIGGSAVSDFSFAGHIFYGGGVGFGFHTTFGFLRAGTTTGSTHNAENAKIFNLNGNILAGIFNMLISISKKSLPHTPPPARPATQTTRTAFPETAPTGQYRPALPGL